MISVEDLAEKPTEGKFLEQQLLLLAELKADWQPSDNVNSGGANGH